MSYVTPDAFNDLYFDFTGYAHPGYPAGRRAIAQDLAAALAEGSAANAPGPIIVATATGIYAYGAGKGHPKIGGAPFRAIPNTGFYEITSVSHVGPAIAYLGVIQALGKDTWKNHLGPLIEHLRAVRDVNAAPLSDHWSTACACPAWVGREESIKNLVDYACALAGHYLVQVRDDLNRLDSRDILESFLNIATDDFPIGFNTVMVGTFAIEGLKSAYDIYTALGSNEIEWESAKVILHNRAGTNFTAGLTPGTNWVHPLLIAMSGGRLPAERILITPYAPIPEAVGAESLSDEDFDALAEGVWGQLYSRPEAASRAFANVADIETYVRPAVPGDYGVTRADQIDDFIVRLKHSTANVTEMQSNTVGFWLGGEALAKNWDVTKMDIPGLTHGLPRGLDRYPPDAPVIPD